MSHVASIVKTCNACPSQWEGVLTSGEPFYVRFRWGHLTISFGAVGSLISDAIRQPPIYEWNDKDDMRGAMEYDEMELHLHKAIDRLNSKSDPDELTIQDYKAVIADYKRLVRELDVLLNGEEGAAKQASLCDIVGQVQQEGLTFKALQVLRDIDKDLEYHENDSNSEDDSFGNVYSKINITRLREQIKTALT